MRVLVCGGRDYNDTETVFDTLDALHKEYNFSCLIQGGARGADRLASRWASARRIEQETYIAKWSEHGMAAGPIRNKKMLTEGKPDLVVAFPGGRGTVNMVEQSREAKVTVMIVSEVKY